METILKDPLADASCIMPLGLHATASGRLAFDPRDDSLLEDLRTLVVEFSGRHDALRADNPAAAKEIPSLTIQRDMMSDIMGRLMEQMLDDGGRVDMEDLLATTFARFPQFADLRVFAQGTGNQHLDPDFEDKGLADEIAAQWGVGG
ncbi:MAG: hypothetical protein HC844_08430 [Tabrizicola sp.]|nr:hypothetical protein [Tabrizicola sp.]